jgi:hypothetical protein
MAWGLAACLALVLVGGVGVLGVRLRPYWVAMYRGESADLHGAVLFNAPLAHGDLTFANLRGADLRSADLQDADLGGATLAGADLRGANLQGAAWYAYGSIDGVLIPNTWTDFRGARYDRRTRWPDGFDPLKHGAIREK